MIGPARFSHIETCAREVCHTFRVKDELDERLATLGSLDDMLGLLRAELAELTETKESAETASKIVGKKKQDYRALLDSLDVTKAKRLIIARENSLKSVKASLKKARERKAAEAGGKMS